MYHVQKDEEILYFKEEAAIDLRRTEADDEDIATDANSRQRREQSLYRTRDF